MSLPRGTDVRLRVVNTLTTQLRSPPAVQREVEKSDMIDGAMIPLYHAPRYRKGARPAPTEGHPIRWLAHRSQPGHDNIHPTDCEQCGREVGRVLHALGVGRSGQCDTAADPVQLRACCCRLVAGLKAQLHMQRGGGGGGGRSAVLDLTVIIIYGGGG